MTAAHALALASFAGALLFFAAGATVAALWRARRLAVPETVVDDAARMHAAALELESTRERARRAESSIARLTAELDAARARSERAEAKVGTLADELERANTVVRSRALPAVRPVERPEELEHLRRELASARAMHQQARSAADEAAARLGIEAERLADSEARAKHLASELERARTTSIATGKDAEQLETRARDAERQLAERTQAVRDLATENEQLKGRLNDAEALRAEYVRLRTTVTETAYLKAEVARLEEHIRTMRRDSLGARPPKPARATEPPARGLDPAPLGAPLAIDTAPLAIDTAPLAIGDSLSRALEQFADAHTRATAIADAAGFPLASSGEDGNALAAYAALLLESANRASQLLPVSPPSAIELVDDRGARINMWTFGVERERLMLVNLAVAPVDAARVQAALASLATILAPTPAEAPTMLESPTLVEVRGPEVPR